MSYQARTVGAHIRHTIQNKEQFDELRVLYRKVRKGPEPVNDIGMVEDMIATCLVEWSKLA